MKDFMNSAHRPSLVCASAPLSAFYPLSFHFLPRLHCRLSHLRLCYLLLTAVLLCCACYQPEPIRRDQLERGYILMLPGVECHAADHAGLARGLREAGVDRAIEINEWGIRPFGTFLNLCNYALNRERAARLAGKLAEYRASYPEAPITIIGYSGGGAMALFIAEALPEEVRLDRILLLGAAISPTYNLTNALARCDRGIVNFYSEEDWFMAGWATEIFGTMDRIRSSTAGRLGFRDAECRLLEREGLLQVSWIPEWRKLGHAGFHNGWRSQDWGREVLARYVKG